MSIEQKLNKAGMVASSCCAVHCMLTPAIIIIFPMFIKTSGPWHDILIYGSVVLAMALTFWKAWKLKDPLYLPALLSFCAFFLALGTIIGEAHGGHHYIKVDIMIGLLLVWAHWVNHKVKFCSHDHEESH